MWFARNPTSLFPEDTAVSAVPQPSAYGQAAPENSASTEESGVLKKLGWVSAALGAVALGLIVGRELRQRYKFSRRTPYDLYAHSGDRISDVPDIEFGVGI